VSSEAKPELTGRPTGPTGAAVRVQLATLRLDAAGWLVPAELGRRRTVWPLLTPKTWTRAAHTAPGAGHSGSFGTRKQGAVGAWIACDENYLPANPGIAKLHGGVYTPLSQAGQDLGQRDRHSHGPLHDRPDPETRWRAQTTTSTVCRLHAHVVFVGRRFPGRTCSTASDF